MADEDLPLVVQPETVARNLGFSLPLDEADRRLLAEAILDAQSDVEAYLGCPVTVRQFTQRGVWPAYGTDWVLDEEPVTGIVSYTPEVNPVTGQATGAWTVVYTAGLDGASDSELLPIRRFVKTHAFYAPQVQAWFRRVAPQLAREVNRVSVEGQEVAYDRVFATTDQPGSGAPGTLPTLKSLDKWKRAGRRVYQRPTWPGEASPWPYDDTYRPGQPVGPGWWPEAPPGWGWG
jgi:hypothetical protein